jgi:signal peptidase II
MPRHLSPAGFYGIALGIAAVDQAAKAWIVKALPLGESGSVAWIPGVFHLTHTQNPGMAFSLLENQRWPLVVAALVVLAVIVRAERKAAGTLGVLHGLALSLPLGGAIGNLIDRVRQGYVTDFLDFRLIHFPVFNVADSAITIGIVLLAWRTLTTPDPEKTALPAPEAKP